MTIYTIYLITNLINGKKYVGQTRQKPTKRFDAHKRGYGLTTKAIQKYGIDNFTFEVIYQTLDFEHIDFLECHFIKEHNSLSHSGGHGYNIDLGGNKNKIMSEETRLKISNAIKNMSDDTRTKMSEAAKIKIFTVEHRKNMSTWQKGIKRKPLSEETKKKISESHKGRPQQKVICPHCNKEGGQISMKPWHFDNCKFKQLPDIVPQEKELSYNYL